VGFCHFLAAQKVAEKGALAASLFVGRLIVTGADGTMRQGNILRRIPIVTAFHEYEVIAFIRLLTLHERVRE